MVQTPNSTTHTHTHVHFHLNRPGRPRRGVGEGQSNGRHDALLLTLNYGNLLGCSLYHISGTVDPNACLTYFLFLPYDWTFHEEEHFEQCAHTTSTANL